MFMFGHYLGALQFVSRFLHNHLGISYSYFYKELMKFMESTSGYGFLGNQMVKTKKALDSVLEATGPWGRVVPAVRNNFAWDFEEATIIEIMKNKSMFFDEVKHFLAIHFDLEKNVTSDIIQYQNLAMLDPCFLYPLAYTFRYNIHEVIHENKPLVLKSNCLKFNGKNYYGNFFEYGKETLWWGRRVAAYKNKITNIEIKRECK